MYTYIDVVRLGRLINFLLLIHGVEQDRTHQQTARQGVNFAHQESQATPLLLMLFS
jgi:hypothetical protein